jgi:acyl-CoA thioesterase
MSNAADAAKAAAAHPFDRAVALESIPDGRLRGRTNESYWNMISPFGGMTAAMVLNAILQKPERQGDPVALTVNFAAPIQAGEFFVEARMARANRSTQHWAVTIVQGTTPDVVVNAIAIFGVRRPTWGDTEAVRPSAPDPEASRRFQPTMPMRWPAMYDVRYARVSNDNTDSLTHTWIRDAEPRNVDCLSLTAYCDTFAPRIFFRRPLLVPVGTVSLNIYYHVSAEDLAHHGSAPVFGVAHGQVNRKGYGDQHAQLWGQENTLLATTHQMLWYKE